MVAQMSVRLTAHAVFKQSGEHLAGPTGRGVSYEGLMGSAVRWQHLHKYAGVTGVALTVVSGGGNMLRKSDFVRGAGDSALSPELLTEIDNVGRWGTVDNARLLAGALNAMQVPAQVLLAPGMEQVDTAWGPSLPNTSDNRRAAHAAGRVVVIGGGTGENNCTTDAVLASMVVGQAAENLELAGGDPDVALPVYGFKATKVDRICNRDPHRATHLPLKAYDVVYAGHMLDHPEAYGVSADDLARYPDSFGIVDRRTVQTIADAPKDALVSLTIYNGNLHQPLAALHAAERDMSIGTLMVPGDMEPLVHFAGAPIGEAWYR